MIDQLYREMYQQLLIYAKKALKDLSFAEEAVQDTFRIACAKIEEVEQSQNQKGWLMETLKNVINNIQRRQIQIAKLAMATMINDSTSDPNEQDVSVDVLYSGAFPQEDFLLLKRIALEQLTMAELSDELGISIETCKKRVQRARNRMQKELKNIF